MKLEEVKDKEISKQQAEEILKQFPENDMSSLDDILQKLQTSDEFKTLISEARQKGFIDIMYII